MRFVVKLSPEIIVKSAPVRRRFIRQLRSNLRNLIEPKAGPVTLSGTWDRIEIDAAATSDAAEADITRVLLTTPGIHSFARVAVHPLGDFDAMSEQAWAHYGALLPGKRFVVRVKRSGDHPFTSPQLEREIGGRLLKGVVVEKKAAEEKYEDAVEAGDAAVMLEAIEPGLYTMNVGNLLPQETAKITFRFYVIDEGRVALHVDQDALMADHARVEALLGV